MRKIPQKVHILDPIPVTSLSEVTETRDRLAFVQCGSVPNPPIYPVTREEQALSVAAWNVKADWQIALHWVFKKQFVHRYNIPINRRIAKLYEPMGDWLRAWFELSRQCSLKESPLDWFCLVFREMEQEDLNTLCEKRFKKDHLADFHRKRMAQIRVKENPFDSIKEPHRYRLIQRALSLSEENPDIFAQFVRGSAHHPSGVKHPNKGLLRSWAAWADRLESKSFQVVYVEGDRILTAGKGGEQAYLVPRFQK